MSRTELVQMLDLIKLVLFNLQTIGTNKEIDCCAVFFRSRVVHVNPLRV
mgnify:FL=1